MKNRINNLSARKKSVLIMLMGNVVAQLILFGSTPILTRMYSPTDFGLLASFISVLSILITTSSLSIEKIIPLVKSNKAAINLVYLSIITLSSFCLIVIFVLEKQSQFLFNVFNVEDLIDYYWLIPLSLLFGGLYQIFNYYAIRVSNYKIISISKLSQSFFQVSVQVFLALFLSSNPLWLLIGDSLGRSAGVNTLIKKFFDDRKRKSQKVFSLKIIKWSVTKYRWFIINTTAANFINTINLQLPVLLVTTFYGPAVAGSYFLSQRIIGIPINLITRSIGQVYYGEAASKYNRQPKGLLGFYKKSSLKLLLLSLGPFGLLFLFAPTLFQLFLGDNWIDSGYFVKLLIPMFICQTFVVPLAQTLTVINKAHLQFFWEIGRLITLSLVAIIINNYFSDSVTTLVLGISLAMSVTYIIFYLITLKQLKKLRNKDV